MLSETLEQNTPVLHFGRRKSIIDYCGTLEVDQATSRRFHLAARSNGVFKNEGKLYISLAHDANDIEMG